MENEEYKPRAWLDDPKHLEDYLKRREEYERKEKARKAQCDTFTIEDMDQFHNIPFKWSCVKQLMHTGGVAWFMLNLNNQQIVIDYLLDINDIVVDAQSYIPELEDAHIDVGNLDFDYLRPYRIGDMCCTRVECYPYTPSGKISKYPAIIQYATKFVDGLRTVGNVKILRDGSIGSAVVGYKGNTIKIGLFGRSLVLQRVDNPYLGGNIYKFTEQYT